MDMMYSLHFAIGSFKERDGHYETKSET